MKAAFDTLPLSQGISRVDKGKIAGLRWPANRIGERPRHFLALGCGNALLRRQSRQLSMSDADKSNKDGSRSEAKAERTLPDVAVCRAKASGFADYADCLVDRPHYCRYVFGFGSYFHCLHPDRAEIIARTKAGRGEAI